MIPAFLLHLVKKNHLKCVWDRTLWSGIVDAVKFLCPRYLELTAASWRSWCTTGSGTRSHFFTMPSVTNFKNSFRWSFTSKRRKIPYLMLWCKKIVFSKWICCMLFCNKLCNVEKVFFEELFIWEQVRHKKREGMIKERRNHHHLCSMLL